MSGVLTLIEGNDLSGYSKVILTSPVRLKVKVKTISGPRMANGWQFTSIITITVTYQRRSVRQKKAIGFFYRYFHLVGLAEAKKIHMFDWTELGDELSRALWRTLPNSLINFV